MEKEREKISTKRKVNSKFRVNYCKMEDFLSIILFGIGKSLALLMKKTSKTVGINWQLNSDIKIISIEGSIFSSLHFNGTIAVNI